jgi:ABC-type transport system involved in multi-copper enzyme maturation permease subunit
MNARQVWIMTRLTVRETARRRILWVLFAIAVVSVALVAWGVDQLVSLGRAAGTDAFGIEVGVSQVLILIAFLFSFVVATSAAFLGAPAVGGDVETGTLLAILARPVGRAEIFLGRWLGLAAIITVYLLGSSALALGAVAAVSGYLPPDPGMAIGFLLVEALAVLTLALTLGTRLPAIGAGAIALGLFGLSWFAGVLGAVAVVFDADSLRPATDLLRALVPTDLVWRGVIFALEPATVLAGVRAFGGAANPFFAATAPSEAQVAWALLWVVLVGAAGILLFDRREL